MIAKASPVFPSDLFIGALMEIDLQFFAQRVAMIAILAGFVGGCLFVLAYGAVVAMSERLRARSDRLDRIAQARIRHQSIVRAMPRG